MNYHRTSEYLEAIAYAEREGKAMTKENFQLATFHYEKALVIEQNKRQESIFLIPIYSIASRIILLSAT